MKVIGTDVFTPRAYFSEGAVRLISWKSGWEAVAYAYPGPRAGVVDLQSGRIPLDVSGVLLGGSDDLRTLLCYSDGLILEYARSQPGHEYDRSTGYPLSICRPTYATHISLRGRKYLAVFGVASPKSDAELQTIRSCFRSCVDGDPLRVAAAYTCFCLYDEERSEMTNTLLLPIKRTSQITDYRVVPSRTPDQGENVLVTYLTAQRKLVCLRFDPLSRHILDYSKQAVSLLDSKGMVVKPSPAPQEAMQKAVMKGTFLADGSRFTRRVVGQYTIDVAMSTTLGESLCHIYAQTDEGPRSICSEIVDGTTLFLVESNDLICLFSTYSCTFATTTLAQLAMACDSDATVSALKVLSPDFHAFLFSLDGIGPITDVEYLAYRHALETFTHPASSSTAREPSSYPKETQEPQETLDMDFSVISTWSQLTRSSANASTISIDEPFADELKDLRVMVSKVTDEVSTLKEDLKRLSASSGKYDQASKSAIKELSKCYEAIETIATNQVRMQERLDAISKRASSGAPMPDLSANLSSMTPYDALRLMGTSLALFVAGAFTLLRTVVMVGRRKRGAK